MEEVRSLLENDQIEEFQFEMRFGGGDYARLLQSIKTATRLKRL